MNVNGARFHLLLGESDWSRCAVYAGVVPKTLAAAWLATPAPDLEYDDGEQTLRLRRELETWVAAPADLPVDAEQRRGAASDRFGNLYVIGDDRRTLYVRSSGSGKLGVFETGAAPTPARDDFAELGAGGSGTPPREYLALAVTSDHYLVVAWRDAAAPAAPTRAGLSSFDLLAGGPAQELLWPLPDFAAWELCPRCGGGVWLLDRTNLRLWEFDARMSLVSSAQDSIELEPEVVDDFQGLDGAPRVHAARRVPGGIDLSAAGLGALLGDAPHDLVAIEPLHEDSVLLLDVDTAQGRSRVLRYRRRDGVASLQASDWLQWSDDAASPARPFLAQDFAFAALSAAEPAVELLLLGTRDGNQAIAYAIDDGDSFALQRRPDFIPMRRWRGRALQRVGNVAWYDSGERWVPLVAQARARYAETAEFITPCFDSGEIACTWDRLLLDAVIPPDCGVEIWSRAADETLSLFASWPEVPAPWQAEPAPYRRSQASELPWLKSELQLADAVGSGSWELLFQQARGRYLQLRIRLSGSGRATPRLRALRAWYPRFSYAQRFLPPVWREEPAAASFIERFLGNFEGTLSGIEDRIATLQALLDPRSAPGEALDWLASWFDVALDPAWDDARRRLFLRHAYEFFSYRGTLYGLHTALSLAFDACVDERLFAGVDAPPDASGIRIVEQYLTRRFDARVLGDAGSRDVLPRIDTTQRWTPNEGNAGLVQRWATARGLTPGASETLVAFDLAAPADAALATQWNAFTQGALGFVPALGAAERAGWQRFLLLRYGSVAALSAAHAQSYASFDAIRLPSDRPGQATIAADWLAYLDATAAPPALQPRARWQDFLARRYRRIGRLNAACETHWLDFAEAPLPDALPYSAAAQNDWLQFEGEVMAMQRRAHRFAVLLPLRSVEDDGQAQERLRLARRIVELEKPAHTIFELRFYWAMFRIGEARLGLDTTLGQGSRAPELIPSTVLGRGYVGASFVAGPAPLRDGDRLRLDC
ncbi:phage tail protein [Solimonas soli]|uniref:phage tail protein n=1 Tax=Solimonas soli TaxID=413479 RepID=UPI0004807BE9|nr:phage tail protein [Solimonas soli]